MRKYILAVCVMLWLVPMLTACEVHFGDVHYSNVPWWVIAIPTVLLLLFVWCATGKAIAGRKHYCPSVVKHFIRSGGKPLSPFTSMGKACSNAHIAAGKAFAIFPTKSSVCPTIQTSPARAGDVLRYFAVSVFPSKSMAIVVSGAGSSARILRAISVSRWEAIYRFSGRAPYTGSYPASIMCSFAVSVTVMCRRRSARRFPRSERSRSMMPRMFSRDRGL